MSVSFYKLNIWRKKTLHTHTLLLDCRAYFFVNMKRKMIYASVITAEKEQYKRVLFALLFSFLHSFVFTTSAFTHFRSISIVRGHHLTVSNTMLFGFSLSYLNEILSYQSSLARKSVNANSIILSILKIDQEISCLQTSWEQEKYLLFFDPVFHSSLSLFEFVFYVLFACVRQWNEEIFFAYVLNNSKYSELDCRI